METIKLVLAFVQAHGVELSAAALAILGGARVIAQYTPWQADDHILDVIEKPVRFLADLFSKEK